MCGALRPIDCCDLMPSASTYGVALKPCMHVALFVWAAAGGRWLPHNACPAADWPRYRPHQVTRTSLCPICDGMVYNFVSRGGCQCGSDLRRAGGQGRGAGPCTHRARGGGRTDSPCPKTVAAPRHVERHVESGTRYHHRVSRDNEMTQYLVTIYLGSCISAGDGHSTRAQDHQIRKGLFTNLKL